MRLIDADELRKKAYWMKMFDNQGITSDVKAVSVSSIDFAPTIEAAEIVRCKDCQYSHEPSVLVKGLVECEKSCSGECLKREDWYCPLGERRGD